MFIFVESCLKRHTPKCYQWFPLDREIRGHFCWSLMRALPGLWMAASLLCAHVAFPWCVRVDRERKCSLFSSYKATGTVGLGSRPNDIFKLYPLKTLSPNTVTLGARGSTHELGKGYN